MKNLIITLTLLLGVMSYGQGSPEGAYVIEYDNEVFTHRRTGNNHINACTDGVERHYYLVSFYSNPLRDDILVYRPAVSDSDNRTVYHWVSDADRDAFRADLIDGRDENTGNTGYLRRYYNRDGGLSLTGPTAQGCGDSSISAQEFLEGQPGHDASRSTTGAHYFGTIADTYITVQPGGFMVEIAFGNAIEFFPFTNIADAYAKLQELLALRSFERELIALGFVDEMHHEYEWNQQCSGSTTSWNWRVDVQGDRINLRDGKLGFTSTGLSIDVAMQRIRGRLDHCQ